MVTQNISFAPMDLIIPPVLWDRGRILLEKFVLNNFIAFIFLIELFTVFAGKKSMENTSHAGCCGG